MSPSCTAPLRFAGTRLLALLFALLWLFPGGSGLAQADRFSHSSTRFALTGAHTAARCESCHVQGVFKGTPTQCVACHSAGSRMPSATPMPAGHVSTVQPCDVCHNTASFTGARFRHIGVAPGTCA